MRPRLTAALTAASLLALAACNNQAATDNAAQPAADQETAGADPIDGTWKADLATVQIEQKPDVFLIKDGKYSCPSCVPPVAIAADGAFHPVSGSPYYDSASVKVVDDHTILRTSKMGDRTVGETKLVVSNDGKILTGEFTDSSVPDAKPVIGKYNETRLDLAPAGAHALSGSWKTAKVDAVSDEGLITTFKVDGDALVMSTPSGQSYTAKLDGTDAPIKGDTAGTVASVERLSATSYRETDKRDGKTVGVGTFTVGADGKLNVVFEDKVRDSTTRYTAVKQ